MKRFIVCLLVLVMLTTPVVASARGGGWGLCILGALFLGLAAQPPQQQVVVMPAQQCVAIIPEHAEQRWDPYYGNVWVRVPPQQVIVPCQTRQW